MGKLKLNLDEIKVESFETNSKNLLKRGTIIGANVTVVTADLSPECVVDVDCELSNSCADPTGDYGTQCSNLSPCYISWDMDCYDSAYCISIQEACDRTFLYPNCS